MNRKPDYDLQSYLTCNKEVYTLEDIQNILATVPGHNDEDYWYWVLRLKDGTYVLTEAWCDYTGWDCQSGGNSSKYKTHVEAVWASPLKDGSGRAIRKNLAFQIGGAQPYGLEVQYD